MVSAAPTIVTFATDSVWVVATAVSIVTFGTAIILRRIIGRSGVAGSAIVLTVPLLIPLVAAAVFRGTALPEIAILRPATDVLMNRTSDLVSLVLVPNPRDGVVTPYALSSTVGTLVFWAAAGLSIFMLVKRLAGHIAIRRFVASCRVLPPWSGEEPMRIARRLSEAAGLKRIPSIYVKSGGGVIACAFGTRHPGIILSAELLESLEPRELEAVLAHEIAHLRSHDVPLMVVAGALRDVMAWNPISHLAYRRLHEDREIVADRNAALLTGSPLAVASGLVKMCRLERCGTAVGSAAPAFLRSRSGLKRRVNRLLALADGDVAALSDRRTPYALAALLAVALGLSAGARVTAGQGAFAFVWGTPETSVTTLWQPGADAWDAKSAARRGSQAGAPARPAGEYSGKLAARFRMMPMANVSVREEDVPKWVHAVAVLAASERRLGRRALQAVGWQAVPVFSGREDGGFGFYRLKQLREVSLHL